ncbi:type II toxin-antitoxin system antitoxin SocA domain-containing protein [Pediococcus argentinicus]|uniref:Xre family toxin-antitoxin system n=1 Tax=Pediococcus argentinicus TaxID=480391 RepID=A0A0R2NJU3_9LACO|nr:type II toxin-antitoxin system antitoxin SocA domain-containing protein [Pediococcus argentinicus]KRO26062.1 xre family toxin-antitoxin system [Pediococcus argentinicus]NKZ21724.1 DUF4065 domain-containing protein [Pediococcus argentinicus]GEP18887.1 hypothetical protein LSA03_02710 [Pediococcus argentinicus]
MTYKKDYTNTYIVDKNEYKVTAPALFDSETNELIPDDYLDEKAVEIARKMHRDKFGLISANDLKKYRERVGLSQRDLSELTGLSPNTIALYESGAFPTIANNRLLKSFINNDQILREYIENNRNNYSPKLVQKVTQYFEDKHEDSDSNEVTSNFNAIQLANWFRVENFFARENNLNIDPITQMKVIKLLYFAYGRFLTATHNKLFDSKIVHLQYGPVIEDVHNKFNGKTILDIEKPDEEAMKSYSEVSSDAFISEILKNVNDDYIDYNASRLSKITHQKGSPWNLTASGHVIRDQLILETFERGEEK